MSSLALLLIGLFGLQGPPEHGFEDDVYIETLVRALADPDASVEQQHAILDALGPHAEHPRLREATPALLDLAERSRDGEVAALAVRLVGERGAPISRPQQARLLRLVHPHWQCLGYRPDGADVAAKRRLDCGTPAFRGASTPAGRVAGWAAWASARVGPDRLATTKVILLLLLSFDDFTRAAAADGLVHLGPDGLPLLEYALRKTKDPGVQARLTEAWARGFGRDAPPVEVPQTLIEFFRARAKDAPRRRWRRTYRKLLLHLEPDPTRIVAGMIADLDGQNDYFVLRELATMGATASAALPHVLAAIDSKRQFYGATEALEHIVPEGERPRVARFLADRLDEGRGYALLRVLERLGPPGRRALAEQLRTGPVELRRQIAGLRPEAPKKGETPRPSVLDGPEWQSELRTALTEDADAEVRAIAARNLETPEACELLLARAEVETAPRAFAGLAAGLANCGAPAVPHLLDWAHADPPVGEAARRALVPAKPGAPRPPAPISDVLTVLLGPADAPAERWPRYRGADFDDRGRAGSLGVEAVADLAARLSAPNAKVKSDAAYVLGLVGPAARGAADALARALDDPDEGVRQWAAWSLGRIGAAEVAPDLVSATTDPSYSVRRNAAAALVAVGGDPQDILLSLDSKDRAVVAAVAEALARAPEVPPALVPRLVELLDHEDKRVQRDAARALPKVRPASPELKARLRTLTRSDRARVRWAAADALLMVGDPGDIVPALMVRRAAPKAAQAEDAATMRKLDRMMRF